MPLTCARPSAPAALPQPPGDQGPPHNPFAPLRPLLSSEAEAFAPLVAEDTPSADQVATEVLRGYAWDWPTAFWSWVAAAPDPAIPALLRPASSQVVECGADVGCVLDLHPVSLNVSTLRPREEVKRVRPPFAG